jgi:hypothetical protein
MRAVAAAGGRRSRSRGSSRSRILTNVYSKLKKAAGKTFEAQYGAAEGTPPDEMPVKCRIEFEIQPLETARGEPS